MIEKQTSARASRRPWGVLMVWSGHIIVVIGLSIACWLATAARSRDAIPMPWLLGAGTLVLWPKWGAYELVTVRKIICVYLCSVPLSMIISTVVEVSPFGLELEISTSLLVLVPLALGRILSSMGRIQGDRCAGMTATMRGWVSACCCLIIHGSILLILLNTCYGYGFERSPLVLGWLGLFYLATWALWETLDEVPFRRCVAVVLAAFYGIWAMGQGR